MPALLQAGQDLVRLLGCCDQHKLGGRTATHRRLEFRHRLDGHLDVLGVASRPAGDLLDAELVVEVGVDLTSHGGHVTYDLGGRLAVHRHVPPPLPAGQIGDQGPLVTDHRPGGDAEPFGHAARALQHAAGADHRTHAHRAESGQGLRRPVRPREIAADQRAVEIGAHESRPERCEDDRGRHRAPLNGITHHVGAGTLPVYRTVRYVEKSIAPATTGSLLTKTW